ncbi:putative stress-response A/B barrel domain-containing protein HS1/DABB1 [Helianthus annuus]|nr:putative stress-response A/B barrel domain-containing protein HS1/DABB1 [Helianthus annuus]
MDLTSSNEGGSRLLNRTGWGTDVSIENLHQGFTHVFESTFETVEGIATYISHPVHVEFATLFLGHLDKVLVVDFKPTAVDP